MQKFIKPADRWILVVSGFGVIALGRGWQSESLIWQLVGYMSLVLTAKLINDRYTGWRAILHLDLFLLLSGLLFLFS